MSKKPYHPVPGTSVVIVSDGYRRATLLVDISDKSDVLAASRAAIARANAGNDTDQRKLTAIVDASLASDEMIDLINAKRDRPDGLDPDEQTWLAELIERTGIEQSEIDRYNARRRIGYFARASQVDASSPSQSEVEEEHTALLA